MSPPVWGAIIDDFWVLHTDEADALNREARDWCPGVARQWEKDGVLVNESKDVDAQEGAEIQGAEVDANLHSMRLGWRKTNLLMRSCLLATTQWRPSRGLLSRIVGKLGMPTCSNHACDPCLKKSTLSCEKLGNSSRLASSIPCPC